jgi:hypothetical protein
LNKKNNRINDPRKYCRNCNHAYWLHSTTWYWSCGRKPRDNFDKICPCMEYVPSDNLEYLEYCEAKRNSNEK